MLFPVPVTPLALAAGSWGTVCTAKPMASGKGCYFRPLFAVGDAEAGWEWPCAFLFWSARPPTPWPSSGATGLRRGQSRSVLPQAPCQARPAHGCCSARFLSPRGNLSPAPTTLPYHRKHFWAPLLQGWGAQAVPQNPHSPCGAGSPWQSSDELGAAGHKLVNCFLQCRSSKRIWELRPGKIWAYG